MNGDDDQQIRQRVLDLLRDRLRAAHVLPVLVRDRARLVAAVTPELTAPAPRADFPRPRVTAAARVAACVRDLTGRALDPDELARIAADVRERTEIRPIRGMTRAIAAAFGLFAVVGVAQAIGGASGPLTERLVLAAGASLMAWLFLAFGRWYGQQLAAPMARQALDETTVELMCRAAGELLVRATPALADSPLRADHVRGLGAWLVLALSSEGYMGGDNWAEIHRGVLDALAVGAWLAAREAGEPPAPVVARQVGDDLAAAARSVARYEDASDGYLARLLADAQEPLVRGACLIALAGGRDALGGRVVVPAARPR